MDGDHGGEKMDSRYDRLMLGPAPLSTQGMWTLWRAGECVMDIPGELPFHQDFQVCVVCVCVCVCVCVDRRGGKQGATLQCEIPCTEIPDETSRGERMSKLNVKSRPRSEGVTLLRVMGGVSLSRSTWLDDS
jgi:hypothetical protein